MNLKNLLIGSAVILGLGALFSISLNLKTAKNNVGERTANSWDEAGNGTSLRPNNSSITSIAPATDNTTDLGSSTLRFKNIFLSGILNGNASSSLNFQGQVSTTIARFGAHFVGYINIVGVSTTPYVVTPTSTVTAIFVDTSANTSTIMLPDPALNVGREIYIKDYTGNANVHALGVNYFYFVTTITLQYGTAHVISNGNGWQSF